jgi:hypothetical protein
MDAARREIMKPTANALLVLSLEDEADLTGVVGMLFEREAGRHQGLRDADAVDLDGAELGTVTVLAQHGID